MYLQLINSGSAGRVVSEEIVLTPTKEVLGHLLEWTMIDVGFGDANLLILPGGGRILIDAENGGTNPM